MFDNKDIEAEVFHPQKVSHHVLNTDGEYSLNFEVASFVALFILQNCLFAVRNLVTIATERYLAVCKPFKHNGFTKQKVFCVFILMYMIGIPCTSVGALQVCFNLLNLLVMSKDTN